MEIKPRERLLVATAVFFVIALVIFSSGLRRIRTWRMPELDGVERTPRHYEYWGGYSIEVPSPWEVRGDPNSPFQRLARLRTDGGESMADILQFRREFTADTHEKSAMRMLSIFEEEWQIRDVKSQSFETEEGVAGTELLFYGQAPNDSEECRYAMYFIEEGEVVLEITRLGPAADQDPHDDEIREIVTSLRIEYFRPPYPVADGVRRYEETLGGYSCVPPAGWESSYVGAGLFRGYISPDPEETRRVITVGRNPPKAATPDEHFEQFLPLYSATFNDQVEILDRQPFTTDDGLTGTRFTALIVRPRDCVELRNVVYLFLEQEGTLECQCVGHPDFGDQYDAEYDAFARSLRIETPPIQKSAQKKSGGI